ncbi:MAG: flagellar motor protein MotB [Pseudomonadota bacterium]
MSVTPPAPKEAGGAPRWMTTFADLMAVLVVFFVMLYAFSTLDAERYEQLADSLREVLGSTVVEETTPSIPAPTIIDLEGRSPEPESIEPPDPETAIEGRHEIRDALQQELSEELEQGLIEIADHDDGILLRFEERAAFELGQKELDAQFVPVLHRVAEVLARTPGQIEVSGHTDDLPMRSDRFRSNWDLSSARAVSVLHVFENAGIQPARMHATGHADTRPLMPNTDAESRAKNRRVEVAIIGNPPEPAE